MHEISKAFFICLIIVLVLLYRDPNAEDKMNPFAEQEAWEEHQIGRYFCIIILKFSILKKFLSI